MVGGSSDETSKRQRNTRDILHDGLQSLQMKSGVKSKNGNPCAVCSTFRIQDREEDWGILYRYVDVRREEIFMFVCLVACLRC